MPGFVDTTSYTGLVELISIDLTPFGDAKYHFASTNAGNGGDAPQLDVINWNGEVWAPLPFESTGWKKGGEKSENPKINLPDYNGLMFTALRNNRNGIGAAVERYQVLDPTLGANAPYTYEAYQLLSYTGTGVTLSIELATAIDITDAKFLGFKMMRENYPGLGSQLLR